MQIAMANLHRQVPLASSTAEYVYGTVVDEIWDVMENLCTR